MEALTFPVENEHVFFFFFEGRVTTKQCDNCENEFTVPGLLHSSYLSPLKKKKNKKNMARCNPGRLPEPIFYTINKKKNTR